MSEKNLLSSLSGKFVKGGKTAKVKEVVTSNLEELFTNPNHVSYISELKKAIFHMERLCPKEITTPFKGNCLEIASSGSFFVFGSIEGRIAVIDKDSKEIIHDMALEGGSIFALLLYNSDNFLISAGKDGIIRKFDFSTFKQVKSYVGHDREINSLAISLYEDEIFSASDDCTVRAWAEDGEISEVLYTHDKAVLCLDRSLDGRFLVSGGSDKKVKFFSLQERRVTSVLNELTSSVWSVKISNNNKYVAAGDSNALIKVWDFETLALAKTLTGHTKRVSHLEFNSTETLIVSSSNDHTLRIWNLVEDKNELILTGHTDWIKSFKLSKDEKYIYSIAENFKINIWYFPKFDLSCRKKGHVSPVLYMCYAKISNYLFTADSKEIKVWDLQSKSIYKTLSIGQPISSICINSDNNTLIAAYRNREIHFWNVADGDSEVKLKHSSAIITILASPDHKYLAVGDSNFRVTVYNKRTFDALIVFRRHNSVVNTLTFGKPVDGENHYLYSGGGDCVIYIYSLKENKSMKLGSHTTAVTTIGVSRNNELLISGDESGSFKIWHLKQLACIKIVQTHTEKITGIYFNENSKYFWISSLDCSLSLYNSTSFAEVTHLCTKFPISAFCMTSGEKDIIMGENDEVNFLPNILNGNQFFIYGPGREYYSFMRYLMQMCEGNEQPHDPEMDKWIVVPFEFNALHFYSYFNLPMHLKAALANNSPFYYSKSGYSPIQIAIDRNFRDCINVIIKSIRLNVQEDPYSVSYLEDSIIKLNELGFRGLDEFYGAIMYRTIDKVLPKFCHEDVSLPKLVNARTLGPQEKDFFKAEEIASFGKCISFWQSALKVDVVIGSSGSIEFLESLVESPNTSIFTTQFIREIVLYKWKYLKWFLLPQAMMYFLYMVILSYYLIYLNGEKSNLAVGWIFGINICLTSYEVFQMTLTRLMYLQDVWNYIDMTRITLCFLYCILYFYDFDEKTNKQILVSLTFMTMLRGISYFRLFDETRYMINLLSEVFVDMTSFLILLAYSTYSFALIYFIMVNNILSQTEGEAPKPFTSYVATAYLLNLGDFNTDGYGTFEWLIFFFASVINPLIMLNLLISIMGDTFGRVKEEKEIADMKELTQMVIEGEYLCFCKRHHGKKTYMQLCKEEEVSAPESTPVTRVNKLKLRLKNIDEVLSKKHEETKGELKDSMAEVNSKLDEMTTLIEQISLTQEYN